MSYADSLKSWAKLLRAWCGSALALVSLSAGAVIDEPFDNIVWPRALPIELTEVAGVLEGENRMPLLIPDESRWFKFKVQPGSRVVVTLDELKANYDLVLFKDIARTYQQLVTPSDLPLIDAEFADDAFSPAQFSPAQFSPAQFSPAAFSPAQFSPAQFSPAQFSPAQFSPAQFSPAQFSPDTFAPAQFSPAQFSPAQFSPAQFSPAQFSPAQFSPAQFSEEAYASAQTRSVIAVSAFDGTLPEGVIANTWNEDTEFYIRVRGRQGVADEQPFHVSVFLFPGVCAGLSPIPLDGSGQALPPSTFRAPAGGFRTLILTDLDRLTGPGSTPERTALSAKLSELAARPDVQGTIVDVGSDPWVAFFNQQADLNQQCPYGKNLVAEAIRAIIERSRPGNALEYIVLVGGDGVLPFFRQPDEAMLGPEVDYIPPVFEFSTSQASLRNNYFLSQDRYGARCEISRKLSRLAIPDLAVGRLVETADEVINLINAYLENPGGVAPAPTGVLVTGYDFLQDAADEIAAELQAGTGIVTDRLIAPSDLAPSDPESWTAADLEAALLGKRHEILFLAGHFSAGSALAADYKTSLPASKLLTAPTGFFRNCLFYSAGCHSGYNLVDGDAIPGITVRDDWAQISARLGMTLVAGTGYQYGDTDFVEYSERLYLYFTRELRSGSGPVPIGKALVRAKRQYLSSTVDLRGIHEKSVYQASLFGLPMFSLNLPGARLPGDADASVIGATSPYATAPGSVLNLRFADLTIHPVLTPHTLVLNNAEFDPNFPNAPAQVTAKWYSGSAGVTAHPAEPVLPLETRSVGVQNLALRGVGFRGGRYDEEANLIPLTSAATTEIRGVHPAFLSDVLFPPKFWRVNYFGLLCDADSGATRLMVNPAQFQSYPASDAGTLRTFSQLDFRLFYSAEIQTYSQDTDNDGIPDTTATPALSAPPQISNVDAWSDPTSIRFRIQVIGNPAAGLQETWVTYTSVSGPRSGVWASLDLSQDPTDSRFWQGSIPRDASAPEDLRFIVQSVNGVGLVSFSSNLGAYFIPNETAPPAIPPTAASVELLSPPATGAYGQRITVRARLTSGGNAVPNQPLSFHLGGLQSRALTGPDGVAQIQINLLRDPSPRPLELSARWLGSRTLAPAQATTPFLLGRSPTTLSVQPTTATVRPNATDTLWAGLADPSGRPLPEQGVLFVVDGSGGTRVVSSITDFNGRAALGLLDLPAGSYTTTAYFGQSVQPPPPFSAVGGPNLLYEASSASATLIIDAAVPTAVDDSVEGLPGKPLKIAVSALLANDLDPAAAPLVVSGVQAATGRGAAVTLSGAWVLIGNLPTGVRSDAFEYEIANPGQKTSRARVVIRLKPDEAPSSNLLGATAEDGRLRLRFVGIPGRTYRVQFSTSPPGGWETLGQTKVGPDGIATFLAPAPVGDAGFYRTAYP
jgi:uncharacterized protein YjbI with pentapeptide repeats